MSLNDIGKFSDVIKDIKGIDKTLDVVGQGRQIAGFLNGLSSFDDALKVLDLSGVSKKIAQLSLNNSKFSSNLKDNAEALANFSKEGKSAENVFTGLGTKIKDTAVGIKSFVVANPILTAGLALATASVVAAYKYATAFDNAVEKAKESQSAYSSTASELESMEAEAESYKSTLDSLANEYEIKLTGSEDVSEIIQKLQSADLSLEDKAQVENIKSANVELERQIQLKQQLADQQSKQSAQDALDALKLERTQDMTQSYEVNTDRNGMATHTENKRTDIITATKNELKELESLKKQRKALLEDNIDDTKQTKLFDDLDKDISKYSDAISSQIEQLNTLKASFEDADGVMRDDLTSEAQDYYKSINAIIDGFNNIDLSPAEKQLNQIQSFFDGSAKSNSIKDYITDMLESGQVDSATDALHSLGITLNDIGITGEGKKAAFDDYFAGLISSAEEAKSATNEFKATLSDVGEAFESVNAGADYSSAYDYFTKANELFKSGDVGTDDFQKTVEYFTKGTSFAKNVDNYKYDSDAYVEAWTEAQGKIQRYFTENPINGINNAVTDLINMGKASEDANGEVTWQFKNTAEAANALGISIEATEDILGKLKDQGAEFDNVMFSGEGLERYESALEKIKEIEKSTENTDLKDKLGKIIDQSEIDDFENHLENLSPEIVAKIEFEYDLATIQQQIEELQKQVNTTGGTTKEWGSLNSSKLSYRDKLASDSSMAGAIDDGGYKDSVSEFENLTQKLKTEYKELGEDGRREIQQQQSALLDFQNAYLDMFSSREVASWEDFLGSDNLENVLNKISEDTGIKIKDLESLFNIDLSSEDTEVDIKANDEASDTIASVLSELMGLPKEKVSELIAEDNASDEVISFLAYISEIPEEKLTEINASDGATGVVTYVLSQILGIPEYKVSELLATDNVSNIASITKSSIKSVPDSHNSTLTATNGVSSVANNARNSVNSIPTSKHVSIGGSISSAFTSAIASAKAALASLGGGPGRLSGTTHVGGTTKSGSQLRLFGKSRASGTIEDDSWLKPQWRTKKSEVALTGEEGQELVATRDNTWWTVGDNGAEFSHIPAGSIVFDAKQTKELLTKGHINSRGKAYLSGTAYANGWRRPSGGSSGSGSSGGRSSGSSNRSSSSSNRSSSNNSATDSAKDFSEELDYIEIKIDRIERQIKSIELVAESAFETFGTRNGALKDQISSVTQEISIQQQAYNRYMQAANSVGLSSGYAAKVRDGLIDLETITDETLSENIKKFQDYYNSALDCKEAVEELKETVRELYQQQFDNLTDEYDNIVSLLDHRKNILEGYIDQSEALGYITSQKYYTALITNEEKTLNNLNEEREKLIGSLNNAMKNGNIQKYSEAW